MLTGEAALLVFLDLSAAFDTTDHEILLNRFQARSGLCGGTLTGSVRTFVVVCSLSVSPTMCPLTICVPQG